MKRNAEYSAEFWVSNVGAFALDIELNRFLDSHRKAGLPLCASEAQLTKFPVMLRLERCGAERASG